MYFLYFYIFVSFLLSRIYSISSQCAHLLQYLKFRTFSPPLIVRTSLLTTLTAICTAVDDFNTRYLDGKAGSRNMYVGLFIVCLVSCFFVFDSFPLSFVAVLSCLFALYLPLLSLLFSSHTFPVCHHFPSNSGADDLLSIFAYILIKSGLSFVISESAFMNDFVSESSKLARPGFFLATLQAAIDLISGLDRVKLLSQAQSTPHDTNSFLKESDD